ncbi:MAG: 23S rRNA pseudouridine(2605) synthase RluB [Nevskiales bacterium]
MADRLHKLLAQAGLGSRREIEGWIREGRVKLNGKTAELGQTATAKDSVSVNGRPVNLEKSQKQATRVLLYKKRVGEVVTRRDPEGRPTIFKRLPRIPSGRWIPVGRLDINTSGLLLLTNNGELASRLMHPRYEVEREYAVRVHGEVTDALLEQLSAGVELDDGMARFEAIKAAPGKEGASRNQWYHVVLREGRNREVRRLWESQGLEVSRLMRVRYGPIPLPGGIKSGTAVELEKPAIKALLRAVDLK